MWVVCSVEVNQASYIAYFSLLVWFSDAFLDLTVGSND